MPYAYLNANLSLHGRRWSAVREQTDRKWLIYYYTHKSYTHLHNTFINIVFILRVKHNDMITIIIKIIKRYYIMQFLDLCLNGIFSRVFFAGRFSVTVSRSLVRHHCQPPPPPYSHHVGHRTVSAGAVAVVRRRGRASGSFRSRSERILRK